MGQDETRQDKEKYNQARPGRSNKTGRNQRRCATILEDPKDTASQERRKKPYQNQTREGKIRTEKPKTDNTRRTKTGRKEIRQAKSTH